MSALECKVCGLAACDLPDGIDPELIFEDGLCQVCVRPEPDTLDWVETGESAPMIEEDYL